MGGDGVGGYVVDALLVLALIACLVFAAYAMRDDMEAHAAWMAEAKDSGAVVMW